MIIISLGTCFERTARGATKTENKENQSRIEIRKFKNEKFLSCSKHFRFFYWHPLLFILFEFCVFFFVVSAVVLCIYLQRKFFHSFFFRTPLLLHLNWVRTKQKAKKKTDTNYCRAKCFACIQHVTHSNFECKSVHKATTQNSTAQYSTEQHRLNNMRKRSRRIYESISWQKSKRDNRICAAAHQPKWQCVCSGHVFMIQNLVSSLSIIKLLPSQCMPLTENDRPRWNNTVKFEYHTMHTHTLTRSNI